MDSLNEKEVKVNSELTNEPSQKGLVDAKAVWDECLSIIKDNINPLSFKTWFEPIVPLKVEGKQLTIQVPSQFFYEWLEEHYYGLIKKTLTKVLGEGAKLVYSVVMENSSTDEPKAVINLPSVPKPTKSPSSQVQTHSIQVKSQPEYEAFDADIFGKTNLNPRYTFDNFVKGDCNQLARAAALAVANNPGGTSFNPLLVYGGVGLGKTHLIQAIGNYVLANKKATKVYYVSSEKFTIDFVEAIQKDRVNEFSNFYKSMDVLIVDDIQFLAGKEKTQDNFFHIFNALHQARKQIVLSSDRPPKELKGVDERLISRFQWGLIADIQPPDLETRIAILKKKAEDNGIELPQEVIEYIAVHITSNIRELEGCLISLLAKSSLENRKIDIELAKEVVRTIVKDTSVNVTIEEIQRIVCEYFGIPTDMLKAKTRKQEVATARQIAMYLCKELTDSSLKTIGLHFGGRDHSTVIHACQSVEDEMKRNEKFRNLVEQLRRKIEFNSK
jgi:chromosomal replication initiator protein